MKQKYTILKDEKTGGLTIREHAELSKDMFSLICEETYEAETIKSAMDESKTVIIDTLRTPNLYPISEYIGQIADAVIQLYDPAAGQVDPGPVELVFDDVELFKKEEPPGDMVNEASVEIEDLLEDSDDVDVEPGPEKPASDSSLDIPIDTSDDASHESPDDTNSLA